MSFAGAAALAFYAIGVCALAGGMFLQFRFLSEAGLSTQTLLFKPWKALGVMADYQQLFRAPGQILRFALFALCLFGAFSAVVLGRTIQAGNSLF